VNSTDNNIATTNDYERTIEELRRTRSEMHLQLDSLVEMFDAVNHDNIRLRQNNRHLSDLVTQHEDTVAKLTVDCSRLTSDNERLRIALQTGEQ